MQHPLVKHISTLLFLAAFLVPRVVDLHAFDHALGDEDAISCELCDIALLSSELDAQLPSTSYDDSYLNTLPSSKLASYSYNSPIAIIATPITVYNKPPPVV